MRPVKDQVDAVTLQNAKGAGPADLVVASQPVGRPNAPAPYDPGAELAQALSGLNPALSRFAQAKAQPNEDQIAAGMRARAMQEGNAPVAMTPEQDPWWQQGYMKMHGVMMGSQDAVQMEQDFELHKNDPDFDVNKFLAERRATNLQGMSDKDALAGYLPRLQASATKIQEAYSKQVVVQARDAKDAAINTMIADNQRSLGEMTHEQAANNFQTLQDEAYAQGTPRKEFTNRYIAALVANPNASPYDFDFLKRPTRDGVVPADTDGPKGVPWSAHIEAARDAAYKRQEAELNKRLGEANAQRALWEAQVLKTDPMAISDPVTYIREQTNAGGLYAHPGSAAAAYERITKAQDEFRHNQWIDQIISNMSFAPEAMTSLPEFKQRLTQEYQNGWAKVDPTNPDSIKAMIDRSMQLHEKYHMEDPALKQIADGVSAMGTVPDANGKETLSTSFRMAHSIWRELKNSDNPQLASFNENSSMFLRSFDSLVKAGTPELEAFKAAKIATSEDGRRKASFMFGPGEEAQARQQVASYLASRSPLNWNGNGFGRVDNAQDMVDSIMVHAKTLVAQGYNTKDALAEAQDKLIATSAHDGYRGMARIPPDLGKAKGEQYLALLTKEAADTYKALHNGQELEHYHVFYQTENGKPTFHVTDAIGDNIVNPRTTEQLEQQYLKANGLTPDQLAAGNAHNTLVNNRPDLGVQGQIVDLQRRAQLGELNGEQFRAGFQQIQRDQVEKRKLEAKKLEDSIRAQPQFPPPSGKAPDQRSAIPSPVGVEQSPKDISLSRTDSSPDYALTTAGEGFRNVVYRDTKGNRTIGFGYNLDARKPEQVAADLKASGVTDPARLERVIAGKEGITPDEGQRLYGRVIGSYRDKAIAAVGPDLWNTLPANKQAVLTDIAYNTGGAPSKFAGVVNALREGDFVKAATFIPKFSQRRLDLQLAMWQSPEHFKQLVRQGI